MNDSSIGLPVKNQSLLYVTHGLTVSSPLPLPFVPTETNVPDVTIIFGKLRIPHEFNVEEQCFYGNHVGTYLFWEPIGYFLVKDGKQILIHTTKPVHEDLLRAYLLGPVLAVLLHQRGRLVLHASAVAMSNGCILFLGKSGSGKSTMAVASRLKGYHVLNDDVSAIEVDQDKVMLSPGYSHVRLCLDTALHVFKCRESLPSLDPLGEKYEYPVPSTQMNIRIPLSRLYVLADGDSVTIQALGVQEAFRELVQHSYCNQLLAKTGRAEHFVQCARLAKNVPLCRLTRPRSLPDLPQVMELIEADMASVQPE